MLKHNDDIIFSKFIPMFIIQGTTLVSSQLKKIAMKITL